MAFRQTVSYAAFVLVSAAALAAAPQQTDTPPQGPTPITEGFGSGAYVPGRGVSNPIVVRQVDPEYTPEARAQGIKGEVTLEAVVGADGRISDVRVVTSLDTRYGLDEAAIRAARAWAFKPGEIRGVKVPVLVRMILTFDPARPTFAPDVSRSGQAGVVDPVAIRRVDPRYTSEAMRQKIQGDVELEVVVGANGLVTDARVVRSLDTTYGLDAEALAAARLWQFQPGTLNGQPAAVVARITLTFRMH